MAEWKREIRELAKGFCVPKEIISQVIKKTEKEHSKREMPSFYNGNRNDFLYDNARREIRSLIIA